MPDPVVDTLILDLLEWLAREDRIYSEVMDGMAHLLPQTPGLGGCK
jgi:hypothetical protein